MSGHRSSCGFGARTVAEPDPVSIEGGGVGYSDDVPSQNSAAESGSMRGPHHTRSSHLLHQLGDWSSRAAAGVSVFLLLAAWLLVGALVRFPSWWQLTLYSTTSVVTVVMVFAIQHTQHREQLVTQRKLDELVRAQPGADDRIAAAETATDDELDHLMKPATADVRPHSGSSTPR
jgi:low affinity Fe/Cu permease